MNVPFSYATGVANNAWMEDLPPEDRAPDLDRAMAQFLRLYRYVASEAVVYLLPTHVGATCRTSVFIANLGVVLEGDTAGRVVLSNFTSEPRRGETEVGRAFFDAMGYETHVATHVAPARFEGDAELEHLHDGRVRRWLRDPLAAGGLRLDGADLRHPGDRATAA